MNPIGELSPRECWSLMRDEGAVLIDVRTRAEWTFVGIPLADAKMNPPIFHEWQTYPDMTVADDCAASMSAEIAAAGADGDTPLCFLCRSGVRSLAAASAMSAAGHSRCFNVLGGFEGQPDGEGHRGTCDGWKVAGLPWRQS